jgi:hypothetical protein
MNYQQASRLRKESLLNLIGDRLITNPNLSLGSAVKSSISDKVKAKLTGFKENLDPLNITRKITGGSTLGPVLVGKLLGRSSEDISYFSGIARNKTRKSLYLRNVKSNVENIRRGEGIADALGKLYTLFKKIVKEEKLERELQKDLLVQQEKDATRKHKEIIKALKKLSVPEKLSFIDKVKAKNEKQELPKNEPRTSPGGISFPSFSLPKLSTATKIRTTAGVTAAAGVGALVARGESGGDYNVYNTGKAGVAGPKLNLSDMTVGEVMELQAQKKVFAAGKYQVIPSTLQEAVSTLNINKSQKFNSTLQERIFKDYLISAKRPAVAQYLNSPVDDPKLLRNAVKSMSLEFASVADPDTGRSHYDGSGNNSASITAEEMATALRVDRNKQLASKGIKDQTPSTMLAGSTPTNVSQVNTTTLQNTNINQGQKINSLSVALNNTTKEQSSVIIVQKNINNINNGTDTTQIVNRPVQNRESALMQAQRG